MLYIGSDYAGYQLKEKIKKYLMSRRISFVDVGAHTDTTRNDFTEYIRPVVKPVQHTQHDRGVLICGTGYGMVIGANRFKGVRATLAHSVSQARYARTHDNSNILVLSAWQTSAPQACQILQTWIVTKFQPLTRRVRRFKTIDRWRT